MPVLESILSFTFVTQALRISVPYALPALGATYSERGGVVNIALEGMLLVGAFATVLGTFYSGSPVVGIACGIVAAGILALIHGLACVTFKVDQIITGIALNLLALGVTKFLSQLIFHSSSNSSRIPGLEQLDVLNFEHAPLLSLLLRPF